MRVPRGPTIRRPAARARPSLAAVILALALGTPASGAAQSRDSVAAPRARPDRGPAALHDPGGHPFRTPSGSPLEPVHRLAAVGASRGGDTRAMALAELGDRLGFWIRHGPGVELAGALHAGVFSRFDIERPDQEFQEVHYRVGFLFRAGLGPVAARAEIYHVSSHLGDEYLVRTGTDPISTSREGIELLAQAAPLAGIVVYGGGGLLLRSSEDFDRVSLRAGAEWRQHRGPGPRLYASADAFAWAESDWEPMVSLEAGLGLGAHARVGVMAGFGPSRAEQFFRESETLAGVTFSFTR